MRLYLIGPVAGRPGRNARAFAEAASRLRRVGYETASPLDCVGASASWHDAVRASITAMLAPSVGGVAVLDGSDGSPGAGVGRRLCDEIGMSAMPVRRWVEDAPYYVCRTCAAFRPAPDSMSARAHVGYCRDRDVFVSTGGCGLSYADVLACRRARRGGASDAS